MPDKPPTFDEMPEGTTILTQEGVFIKRGEEMVSQAEDLKNQEKAAKAKKPAEPVK